MVDVATFVRIYDATPSDDLVSKRTAAVKDLSVKYGKTKDVASLLQIANDIAAAVEIRGSVSQVMGKDVEAAVRKHAEAFVAEGHDLEVTVCSLMSALQLFESSAPQVGELSITATLAVGLWSALSFQSARSEPKLEQLRIAVIEAARAHVLESATSSRQRIKIADLQVSNPDPFDPGGVAKSIKSAVGPAIAGLRTNAAVDREELDLLWWFVGGHSELLNQQFKQAKNLACSLSAGLEAGQMLRRLPASAHKQLVLRLVRENETIALGELVKQLGDDRGKLAIPFAGDTIVANCKSVFPLLNALVLGSTNHVRSKEKRSISEWTERALLESACQRTVSSIPAAI